MHDVVLFAYTYSGVFQMLLKLATSCQKQSVTRMNKRIPNTSTLSCHYPFLQQPSTIDNIFIIYSHAYVQFNIFNVEVLKLFIIPLSFVSWFHVFNTTTSKTILYMDMNLFMIIYTRQKLTKQAEDDGKLSITSHVFLIYQCMFWWLMQHKRHDILLYSTFNKENTII